MIGMSFRGTMCLQQDRRPEVEDALGLQLPVIVDLKAKSGLLHFLETGAFSPDMSGLRIVRSR
jgi:hypothetical protein